MSSRFGTVNLPLWGPSNVPLSISGATRETGIIKSAQEPILRWNLQLRDELTAWLINHPNRGSGVGIFGNVQSYQAIALAACRRERVRGRYERDPVVR